MGTRGASTSGGTDYGESGATMGLERDTQTRGAISPTHKNRRGDTDCQIHSLLRFGVRRCRHVPSSMLPMLIRGIEMLRRNTNEGTSDTVTSYVRGSHLDLAIASTMTRQHRLLKS